MRYDDKLRIDDIQNCSNAGGHKVEKKSHNVSTITTNTVTPTPSTHAGNKKMHNFFNNKELQTTTTTLTTTTTSTTNTANNANT